MMDNEIRLEFLDHVALRVRDLKSSSQWYQNVLGLREYKLPEWGEFPVFLLSGKTGLALFPSDPQDPELDPNSRNVKIDHFAFQVTRENFEKAKKKFTMLGLDFEVQDHHYFDSLYLTDPDGHTVELTTLKVDAGAFYK